MRTWSPLIFVSVLCAAPAQQPACLAVEGTRLFVRNITVALPAFGRLDPELPIGFAPVPGARRIFHASELLSLARRFSIEMTTAEDVCFEYAMETLDRSRVLDAMKAALGIPEAQIEIVETSMYQVPRGLIEFPRGRLGAPASPAGGASAWRGDVVYSGQRRFAIWARVKVVARDFRVMAAESLKPGERIEAGQVRVESVEGFPSAPAVARSIDQVAGRLPLRPIARGAQIRLDQLAAPQEVNRGDMVEVEVLSGAARLAFTGRAESAGHTGQTIAIRNPANNSVFRARVKGTGRALVLAAGAEVN